MFYYKDLGIREVHQVVYDDIDEALVMKAAMKTKGGSGPSRC